MSMATTREPRPHARPVHIRLLLPSNGQPPGSLLGPIPLHVAELYVNRGAAEFVEESGTKRISQPSRNKAY